MKYTSSLILTLGLVAVPAHGATTFITDTTVKTLASDESDAAVGLTTGSADDGNNNGLNGDRTGASTVLKLSADDGGGDITFNTTNVSGGAALSMSTASLGHGNDRWGANQNWTFTVDKDINFDALDFSNNENSFSLRSVAWKDDPAASGTGWSFSSNGTIGIFALTTGQIYDFTTSGVSTVTAGTEIGFGAFGGANGGDRLNSFTFTVIPEPTAALLGSLGLLGLLRRRR